MTKSVDELVKEHRDAITVKKVFGDPYEKNGMTIIPAAKLMGGGGGGAGESPDGEGQGSGTGFGIAAKPAGAYVIRGDEVTWTRRGRQSHYRWGLPRCRHGHLGAWGFASPAQAVTMGAAGEVEGSSWSGTTSASLPMALFLGLVVIGAFVVVFQDAGWIVAGGLAAAITLVISTFMYARIFVDGRGVEVRFGPFGWPRITRALADMTSAKARQVEWWRYGLGYRLIMRGSAVVPRSGAAVEVTTTSGRRFIFSTGEAESVARRLDQLIEEERARLAGPS